MLIFLTNIRCIDICYCFCFITTFKICLIYTIQDPKCVKWRQTGGCSPNGAHEEQYDKDCSTPLDKGWSGYCECEDGRKALEKECNKEFRHKTCEAACTEGLLFWLQIGNILAIKHVPSVCYVILLQLTLIKLKLRHHYMHKTLTYHLGWLHRNFYHFRTPLFHPICIHLLHAICRIQVLYNNTKMSFLTI